MLSINKRPVITLISLFSIDLGIRYISSFLRSHGFITYIIFFGQLRITPEITSNNYILTKPIRHKVYPDKNDVNLLINLLLGLKPDLIGISVSSSCFIIARVLTSKIKERLNIPVIWGGIHPTLCPEECIPYTDMVCIGEGEYPMLEVVQKLENKQPLTGIKNLWIKHQDGSIEKNPLRELILNLDSLPYPDFVDYGNKYLIDKTKLIRVSPINASYLKSAYSITSSRGCPFLCSYCCNSVLKSIYDNKGDYVRRRSVENVINELEYIRENREITMIKFWDDVFTYDEDWIAKFVELYRKKIALPFTCYTHPEYTHKNIIKMLRDAGLVIIDIGIQSGSQEFCRDKFKRYQSNEKIIEFAYFLKELGVKPRYNLIMDNPLEDDEDFNASVDFLFRLPRPYIAELYSLCYFPKTEITKEALLNNLITEDKIEGKNNKGLNRYYMCLDVVKDRRLLFRDIIIAMIVSGFFSEKFIRKCKANRFIRNHPKLLLFLLRLYLKFSVISPKIIFKIFMRIDRAIIFEKNIYRRNPRFFLRLINLSLKLVRFLGRRNRIFKYLNFFINVRYQHILDISDYYLEDQNGVEIILFMEDRPNTERKNIYLKIRKIYPVIQRIIFLIEMRSLGDGLIKNDFSNYEIEFDLNKTEIELKIDYSLAGLSFAFKDILKYTVIQKINNNINKEKLYLLSFSLYNIQINRYFLKNNILIYSKD